MKREIILIGGPKHGVVLTISGTAEVVDDGSISDTDSFIYLRTSEHVEGREVWVWDKETAPLRSSVVREI